MHYVYSDYSQKAGCPGESGGKMVCRRRRAGRIDGSDRLLRLQTEARGSETAIHESVSRRHRFTPRAKDHRQANSASMRRRICRAKGSVVFGRRSSGWMKRCGEKSAPCSEMLLDMGDQPCEYGSPYYEDNHRNCRRPF